MRFLSAQQFYSIISRNHIVFFFASDCQSVVKSWKRSQSVAVLIHGFEAVNDKSNKSGANPAFHGIYNLNIFIRRHFPHLSRKGFLKFCRFSHNKKKKICLLKEIQLSPGYIFFLFKFMSTISSYLIM